MDTLEIVEILEEQGFSNKKAIKLAEAINGKSGLATKEDIGFLKEEIGFLKEEINKVESDLREEINKVESVLREDIIRIETKIDLSGKWILAIMSIGFSIGITLLVFILNKIVI